MYIVELFRWISYSAVAKTYQKLRRQDKKIAEIEM